MISSAGLQERRIRNSKNIARFKKRQMSKSYRLYNYDEIRMNNMKIAKSVTVHVCTFVAFDFIGKNVISDS